MIYFTSDQHFGHRRVIAHSNRPFADIEAMDSVMLDNINKAVEPNDTLYLLGDFSWIKRKVSHYRNQIVCRNVHLIVGNHDPLTKQGLPKGHLLSRFSSVNNFLTVRYASHTFVCSHYPMETWPMANKGSFHLHGHSHGKSTFKRHRLDVGVDCHEFRPLTAIDIIRTMEKV